MRSQIFGSVLSAATPAPVVPEESDLDQGFSWLAGAPLQILIIVVTSLITLIILRIIIRSVTSQIIHGSKLLRKLPRPDLDLASSLLNIDRKSSTRRVQRAQTMGSVLNSLASIVVITIMVLLILDALNVNIAPFIASAGIVGVAIGFGAQALVKDFLSGIFMLLEDQYGMGDTVQIGDVNGTVESVGMRVTEVRDANGTLWYIRNGEILKVGNKTQGWARAVISVKLPYETDVDQAQSALHAAATAVMADPEVAQQVLGEPEVGGIEDLTATTMTIPVSARTTPAQQWMVARALRAEIRDALANAGISLTPDIGVAPVPGPAAGGAAGGATTPGGPPSTGIS